jgi:uncharacterized protein YfaS (alpha-2-macroglobulin family)
LTVTNAHFYVSGPGYVAWERSNDDRIELVADKEHYLPGDVAHIMVKSPYESAPALVTIERDGILRHFVTRITGSGAQVNVPVTREMLPNAFVSVVLLQGRTSNASSPQADDVGKPSFKVGYVKLSVSPSERALRVGVEIAPRQYRPRETVEVALQVRDANGNAVPAEVAVSVADLGVLNLINYRMPNPFDTFYRERGLAVRTTETRLHIVDQRDYGEKGEDDGGGGALERAESELDAQGVRRDFRASAFWDPAIQTDSLGRATVRFTLPDNLTAFMAMAVAHTKDSKFGYGERSVTVSKPLILQPALPRFARVGDEFSGGVVVINQSRLEKTVTVVAGARGSGSPGTTRSPCRCGPERRERSSTDFVRKSPEMLS